MRSTDYDELDIDQDESIAFDAAPTAPITETVAVQRRLDGRRDRRLSVRPRVERPEDGIPAFEEPSTTARG